MDFLNFSANILNFEVDEKADDTQAGAARKATGEDYRYNGRDAFEESGIAKDKYTTAFDEYGIRRKKAPRKDDDGYVDFDETRNQYYEDEHKYAKDVYQDRRNMTEEDREKVKDKLKNLVNIRSGKAKGSHPEPRKDETLSDFLERIKQESANATHINTASVGPSSDKNDYDFALSEKRNRSDMNQTDDAKRAKHGDGSESSLKSNDEYVVTTVTFKEDEWAQKRQKKPGDKNTSDKNDDEASHSTSSEMPIKISRKEIRHMQELNKRLYGEEITEAAYVESVRTRLSGTDPNAKNKSENAIENEMVQWESDNFAALGSLISENETSTYNADWKKAMDAQSRRNMAPVIDWSKTVYGNTDSERCALVDPNMFITTREAAEGLVNDTGIHTAIECALRRLRYNTKPEDRVFKSIKDWAAHVSGCDVVYSKCVFYECRIRTKAASISTNISDLGKMDAQIDVQQRMVLYHDMKNGFFVCNHFSLEMKKDSDKMEAAVAIFTDKYLDKAGNQTAAQKYAYRWIGHIYLQYINSF